MQTFKLLGNDSVLLSQPVLIKQFGRAGAQLLNQLHYWLSKKETLGCNNNGVRWIYNSADAWSEQLCISSRQIQRIIKKLTDLGILLVEKLSTNKYDRTNHFTINYQILEQYICSNALKPSEIPITTFCRNAVRQNDVISIQKLPNKDFNKSEQEQTYDGVGEEVSSSTYAKASADKQVKQVKDSNLRKEKKLDDLQETPIICSSIEKNKRDETNLLLPKTSTAQDMLKVWNDIFASKAESKLNKELAPLLVSAFKNKFESNLKSWQRYIEMIKSSPYLMEEAFKLTLGWALKFGTIDRIRAGELGVKLSPRDTSTGQGAVIDKTRINQMIEALPDSAPAKALRHKIAQAIGCAAYYSWFHQAKFCEEGGGIRMVPPNAFVGQYWETHYAWVNKNNKN